MTMALKSDFIDPAIAQYILTTTVREHPVLRELREETAKLPNAQMEIGPDQGQLMALLARTIGARRYLEIGVFTGYSSLVMALALPENGYVLALDVSDEYTAVARRYWQRAGVAQRIDLRLAPALETLDTLRTQHIEPFDMAFIDADKQNTAKYFERCLELVRPGGLILIDNALRGGAVLDPDDKEPETAILRELNAGTPDDGRVDMALLPICDGVLIARKR
jgi:predicted O-methyltransferase YrrM